MIEVKNLSVHLGNFSINDISLTIGEGEYFVILGPTGAGKTVIIECLAGLQHFRKGEIWIDGNNATALPPEERNVGYVPQDYALFPFLNVVENITFGLREKNTPKNEIKGKVKTLAYQLNISHLLNRDVRILSGGEKQRVALARALATSPKILLLDEPLSSLDVMTSNNLRIELRRFHEELGVTTIHVTHNLMEAEEMADRIAILNMGNLEQVETPEDIFYRPKTPFVANFVGVSNILNAQLIKFNEHTARFHITHSKLTQLLEIEVKKYPIFKHKKEQLLCIHPEKITLSEIPKGPNSFPARIVNIVPQGALLKVFVDAYGLKLQAVVPKAALDFRSLNDHIWLCFSPDALQPLCGKSCRAAEDYRACNEAQLMQKGGRLHKNSLSLWKRYAGEPAFE